MTNLSSAGAALLSSSFWLVLLASVPYLSNLRKQSLIALCACTQSHHIHPVLDQEYCAALSSDLQYKLASIQLMLAQFPLTMQCRLSRQ